MSKIRLHQAKVNILVAVGVAAAILLLVVVNAAVILPGLIRVFSPVADTAGKNPVDAESVSRALDAVRD